MAYRPALGVEQYLATAVATDGNPTVARSQHLTIGDDFPMVCETCLGPNPYIRMIKQRFGDKLCKLSGIAFQSFRWKAGVQGRFKETIICKEVALEKNVCQACLSDMSYGVPVGVRDALLAANQDTIESKEITPVSDANRAYHYQNMRNNATVASSQYTIEPSQELVGIARSIEAARVQSSTAFRNLPKLCSFWIKGNCSRVHKGTCPFRPCCGEFHFPELAATHPTESKKIIDLLAAQGPAEIMTQLPPDLRSLLKNASSGGNKNHQAIRDRLSDKDQNTIRYLKRISASSNSDDNVQEELRPELAKALAAQKRMPTNKRHKPYYPSMNPARLGTQPSSDSPRPINSDSQIATPSISSSTTHDDHHIPAPPPGPPPAEAFLLPKPK